MLDSAAAPIEVGFHPIANLFPLMEGPEFYALVADIKANGLHHLVVVFEGAILDGRNRYRACQDAGVAVGFNQYEGNDPLGYVMSANLHRRNINESQRAWIADKVANMPVGRNWANSANSQNKISQPDAARMLGASLRSVGSASHVRKNAIPEFHDRVERGDLTVSLAERVSKLPKEEQQRLVNADEGELRGATKKFRRAEREAELADSTKRASEALGYKVYGVLYVDPPWRFEPYSRDTGMDRAADNHYPTEKIEAIKAMKVPAADNAVLFMWATAPLLPEALDVMKSWGFIYRSNLIWAKPHAGTGYWFRSQHEQLLVGTRGSVPCPAPGEQYCSLIEAPLGKHSVKPASFAEMIEEMFPEVPAVEMFAREPRFGWDVWGNEAP